MKHGGLALAESLFERYARLVCNTLNISEGTLTADQLNELVMQWPQPKNALTLLGADLQDLPVLFHDMGLRGVGGWMFQLLNSGNVMWPICLMPVEHMGEWADDVEALTLLAYLNGNDLGLQVNFDGEDMERNGIAVHLCDFRLTFLRDVELTRRGQG